MTIALGWGVSTAPAQSSPETNSSCTCSDGRQFPVGASLFGKNSARVVVTGFRPDLTQAQAGALPSCKDVMVVGQAVRLKVESGHPFLRRESLKRGTIENICRTKVQFAQPSKSYDFFKDDGSAVTLSDVVTADTAENTNDAASLAAAGAGTGQNVDDLTGKDLIRLMDAEQPADDPTASSFDADDLKESAYFIVRRRLKLPPALDAGGSSAAAMPADSDRNVIIRAGTLGRIEKQSGFRNEPLWAVEILPHSAPPSFASDMRSLSNVFRRRQASPTRFQLASSDIVEINHFFDKYAVEWTRFGEDSDEARKRKFAGTTYLPDIYGDPAADLEENLENARKAGIQDSIRRAVMRLTFVLKNSTAPATQQTIVLEASNSPGVASPHFFHNQCFLSEPAGEGAASTIFRVRDAELAIFQPTNSPQVPPGYYAVDLRIRLNSPNDKDVPVVCRFPSTAIDVQLLDEAERILSTAFVISGGTK